jgi:hypothetical protein
MGKSIFATDSMSVGRRRAIARRKESQLQPPLAFALLFEIASKRFEQIIQRNEAWQFFIPRSRTDILVGPFSAIRYTSARRNSSEYASTASSRTRSAREPWQHCVTLDLPRGHVESSLIAFYHFMPFRESLPRDGTRANDAQAAPLARSVACAHSVIEVQSG